MKTIEVSQFGGPEVLTIVERPKPLPGDGEILVKVSSIGVNPVETYIRAGTYPRLPELPYTPGGNVAGTVEQCGPGEEQFQAGDRVYSSATLTGAYGEYALCDSKTLFHLPDSVNFDEGAALGVPAATAWRALFIRGEAKPGEKVLIHGGSGSVGLTAVQLARAAGMTVFGTAGTEQGLELIEDMGGQPFNHRDEDYTEKLALASGAGFDLIIEMLANKNLVTDLDLLATGGRMVIVGSRGPIEIDPRATMGKETDIRGLAVFNATAAETAMTHAALAGALVTGALKMKISARLKLNEAAMAHEMVMEDGKCGKILLHP